MASDPNPIEDDDDIDVAAGSNEQQEWHLGPQSFDKFRRIPLISVSFSLWWEAWLEFEKKIMKKNLCIFLTCAKYLMPHAYKLTCLITQEELEIYRSQSIDNNQNKFKTIIIIESWGATT